MERELQVYKWLKCVLNGLYPSLCALCSAPTADGQLLCPGCRDDLPRNHSYCRHCGIPLTVAGSVCGRCARRPPPVWRSQIPLRYAPPLDYLVQQMKFHRRLELLPLLAAMVVEEVAGREDPLPQLLVPVPMHRIRLRQRGYNQALELARQISRQLAIPLEWRRCHRLRHTAAQTGLKGRERRRNLRGAFAVRGRMPPHVAIVDDVVTTGSTVQELARVLRRAGAKRVEVWACARAGTE